MPSNTHTVVGGTKRLECRVVGHPAPDIRWFKDGRDITHSGRYNFDYNKSNGVISMVIDNISHKDQGNYRCRAENTEGFASTSAYLLVRAHREHPDEEIEEVHAMELEELFIYKSAEAHSISTERLLVGTNDIDSARKRTFEDIVDGEKENGFDGRYKMVGKDISGKRSSESTILSELNAEEEASSRRQVDGFEETQETIKKMKMVLEESSRTSLVELAEHESKSSSKTSTKSVSESRSESSYTAKMETQALSAKITKSEETNLQASSYVEKTPLKGRKESRQSELVMGVSVETDESSKISSKSRSEKSLVASIESEESSSKAARKTMSAEVTETEISSMLSQEVSSKDSTKEKKVVTSVETEESSLESRKSDMLVHATSETTERLEEKQRSKVTADTSVEDTKGEEVPEACRMEPQEVDADRLGDLSMTGSALNSLANDSGFMEASLLESSQLQLDESAVSQSVESSVETSSLEQAKVSTEQEATDTKAKTARKESFVEESQLTEVIEESTQVQQTELSQSTQESHQIVLGETEVTESTSAKTAVTSQETSHTEETREEFSEDITGLLDEKTEQTTVVEEEEVAAAQEDGEHRTRWVDQITSKTETITIEGEGKKTKELKAIEETAVSAESVSKKEQSAQLDKAKVFKEETKVEPVDSQAITEAEEVSKLAEAEQTAAAVLEAEAKAKASKEEAEESSVDPVSLTNGVEAKTEDISPSEANVEKSTESEEKSDLIQSSDVAVTEHTTKEIEEKVDESEEHAEAAALSAPKIVSVSDDVAISLGEAIRLASRVQGNPQPEVKWFKEGDTVKAGERITLWTEDDVFTLEINEAAAGDAGTYTLTAHNSEGTIFSDVLVTVSIPPSIGPADEGIRVTARLTIPEFVAQPGNVTVRELGTLELVCIIKANPSPTVSWSKAGKPLQADSHMRIFDSEGQYYLEIPQASMDDAGDYTCTASNSEGSVSCTISVFVESRESSVSATDEGAAAMVPLGQRESSSDVSTASLEPATTRYLKLVAAAAAFSLAAFGIKKIVENLPK